MSWVIETLEKIKHRPSMYLNTISILGLSNFINGYIQARRDLGFDSFDSENELEFYNGFQYWLAVKFNCRKSYGWAQLIEENSKDDDIPPMELFFSLFSEYQTVLKEKSYTILKEEFDNLMKVKWEED